MQSYAYCAKVVQKNNGKKFTCVGTESLKRLQSLSVIAPALLPLCPGLPPAERSSCLSQGAAAPAASLWAQCRLLLVLCSPVPDPGQCYCCLDLSLPLSALTEWLQPLLMLQPKWRLRGSSRLLTATYWIIVEYIYVEVYARISCNVLVFSTNVVDFYN